MKAPRSFTIESRYTGIVSQYLRKPARDHYGRHAAGSVLLNNGVPEFHGDPASVSRFVCDTIKEAREDGHAVTI